MRRLIFASVPVLALAMVSGCARKSLQRSVVRATFIFDGTVREAGTSNLRDYVPARANTYVVRVDKIYSDSQRFQEFSGQEITVRLDDKSKERDLPVGRRFVFLTSPLAYGDSLAVQGDARTSAPEVLESISRRRELLLQERVRSADTVVRGRVIAVRKIDRRPDDDEGEHDPQWIEAALQVDAYALKRPPSRLVPVLFPTSIDIVWYASPRFNSDSFGIWVLQEFKGRIGSTADNSQVRQISTGTQRRFTALHPLDFLPGQREVPPRLKIKFRDYTGGKVRAAPQPKQEVVR